MKERHWRRRCRKNRRDWIKLLNEKKKREEMEKPKLVFKLETIGDGSTLMFYIKEMDERFRRTANGAARSKVYQVKSGEIRISSVGGTGFGLREIFLRGNSPSRDNNVVTRKFSTSQEAESYRKEVMLALKYWAKTWEGFKEPKTSVDGEYLTV